MPLKMIKQMLHTCGLDVRLVRNVHRAEVQSWEEKQHALWLPFLRHHNIRTVIDIGANTGQFAGLIHRLCPAARILSFEPLAACHAELQATLAQFPGSQLFPIALGDRSGTVTMHQSEFTPCSSLLAPTATLGQEYPAAADITPVDVPLARLDDVLQGERLDAEVLLKMDVQGFEIPVLRGAIETLPKASLVVIEVCFFRRMYAGAPLFDDIYREMRGLGFSYMGSAEQHSRATDARIVEADAVFERLN